MSENKAIVAICNGRVQAEKAIAELQRLGFDMKQVSVVSKAYVSDEEIVGCYVADGRLRVLGGSAAFWERLWSLLGEAGLFVVPGIGPVVIAGSLVNALATTVKDAVVTGGASLHWQRHPTASASPRTAFSGTRSKSKPTSAF